MPIAKVERTPEPKERPIAKKVPVKTEKTTPDIKTGASPPPKREHVRQTSHVPVLVKGVSPTRKQDPPLRQTGTAHKVSGTTPVKTKIIDLVSTTSPSIDKPSDKTATIPI